MKTTLLLFSLLISISAICQENKKYTESMKRNIAMLDTATSMNTLQLATNSFERIANAEKDEWLPYYYCAYGIGRMSYLVTDKTAVDPMLDRAQAFIDKADSLQKDNSEIYTVKSFILSARIMVDPMTRGAQFGPQSGVVLEKAIQLDPENPRPYMLKGTAALYTPVAFGGGKDKAAVLLQTAIEKYKAFKPAGELMPDWGEQRAVQMLEQCK